MRIRLTLSLRKGPRLSFRRNDSLNLRMKLPVWETAALSAQKNRARPHAITLPHLRSKASVAIDQTEPALLEAAGSKRDARAAPPLMTAA